MSAIHGVNQAGLDPGFQDPFANLSFLAAIPDKLDVYFDLYVASRPHASTMYGHEGYMLFKQLPAPFDTGTLASIFDYVNVKVGAFDLDYGDDNYRRSNNARVQRNPLIGNPLVDPNVEEIGSEIYSIKGPVYWLFGVGSGTTTEHFDHGSEPSFHGKLWGYPLPDLRTSISAYHVDLADSADTSYLYTNGRSGGTFAAILGGGDNPGQILPAAGKDVTAVQGDVTWNHWPFEVYSNVGWVQDSDINGQVAGTPSESWVYGAFEPVYHITPSLYLAGRYSYAWRSRSMVSRQMVGWIALKLAADIGSPTTCWASSNMSIRSTTISARPTASSAELMAVAALVSAALLWKCHFHSNEIEFNYDLWKSFDRHNGGNSFNRRVLSHCPWALLLLRGIKRSLRR